MEATVISKKVNSISCSEN